MSFLDYVKKIPGVNKIISLLGVDKAIFYTVLSVVWSAIAGILGVFFIINYLTLSEQGYWYTFQSLGALATFAELGFTTIITQYISHEYAHLNEKDGKIYGKTERVDKTISLVKFSFKFYIVITIIAFILLSIIGLLVLMSSTNDSYLLMAWVFYSFTGALLLLTSIFGAVIRGFNKVETAQKIITIAGFTSSIAIWIALYAGLNLLALPLGGIVNIIFSLSLFFMASKALWLQMFRSKVTGHYNWLKETLPLQWRYAISWASGYFIFQFIVPVAMFYSGPDLAGKLGLSLVLARTVQSIASSWGITKIPQFNMLVAKKNRVDLDKLLQTIQKQSLSVFILGSAGLIFTLIFIFPLLNWDNRVLGIYEISIILIAEGVNLIVFNWAYYLRSHKQEPYMRISVMSALITAIGVWISFYMFSSMLLALCSYLAAQIIILYPARRILIQKRKDYENDEIGYN